MVGDIRSYVLNKLFFPKVAVIDRPGIIINKTSRKYGRSSSQIRNVFHFEDIFVNLQLETIKRLGRERTAELYYKIGKEIGTTYLLLANAKRPPLFLLPIVIEYIFKNLEWIGFSVDYLTFNNKEKSLVLKGNNLTITNRSGEHSIFVGIISGIFSFLVGKNIEGEIKFDDKLKDYIFVFNKNIKKKFIPDFDSLKPNGNYYKLNFPEKMPPSKTSSFSDLIKFKKIKVNENGRFYFEDKVILPCPNEFLDIITDYYLKIGEEEILERGIINSTEKIAEEILKDKRIEEKIKTIENMMSAFGWGIPYYKKTGDEIIFDFVNPPITKDAPLFRALVLNGFLNKVYNKKLVIGKITNSRMNFLLGHQSI